jgi:3-oxoacyl-[acyl-carrier protein] reductase
LKPIWRERAAANPAGRYGEPDEVGACVAFQCSVHAGFITGQNLLIDGGQYSGTSGTADFQLWAAY